MDSITARVEWAFAVARERKWRAPRAQILAYLAFRGSDSYPSLAKIAEDTRLGTSTVKRELTALESEGLMRREVPTRGQQARGETTVYHLVIAGTYETKSAAGSGRAEAADAVGRGQASMSPPKRPAATKRRDPDQERAAQDALFQECRERGLWRPGMRTLDMLNAVNNARRQGKPTRADQV